MDTLELRIVDEPWPNGEPSGGTVQILVNGRDLADIIVEAEVRAVEIGGDDVAGMFRGMPPEEIFLPSRNLLGVDADDPNSQDDPPNITLYDCECGGPGCWPILVKIVAGPKTVKWTQFRHPRQRFPHEDGPWNDFAVQPFEFERQKYEAELGKDWKSLPRVARSSPTSQQLAEEAQRRELLIERLRAERAAKGEQPLEHWNERSRGPK